MASVRKMSLNNTWRMATLGAIALAVLISSCGGEGGRSLEERAQSIDQSLICPVCPGETIDQAQVELAKQMRATVREKLAEGQSKDEILQFFVGPVRPGRARSPAEIGIQPGGLGSTTRGRHRRWRATRFGHKEHEEKR